MASTHEVLNRLHTSQACVKEALRVCGQAALLQHLDSTDCYAL